MIDTIDTLKSRHPEFNDWVNQIRNLGTDNLAYFGNAYTHEGGYSLQQNPNELAALALLLKDHGMDRWMNSVYLEIGSASGGTGRYLYDKFRFKRFLSIDDGSHQRAPEQIENHRNIPGFRQYVGDSHHHQAPRWLRGHVDADGSISLAFIDGDHSYAGVLQDLTMVLDFSQPGSLVVFHDTVACSGVKKVWENATGGGGLQALAEFVGSDKGLGIGVGVVA